MLNKKKKKNFFRPFQFPFRKKEYAKISAHEHNKMETLQRTSDALTITKCGQQQKKIVIL